LELTRPAGYKDNFGGRHDMPIGFFTPQVSLLDVNADYEGSSVVKFMNGYKHDTTYVSMTRFHGWFGMYATDVSLNSALQDQFLLLNFGHTETQGWELRESRGAGSPSATIESGTIKVKGIE